MSLVFVFATWATLAQPTLVSVVPDKMAPGVSPTTKIQFTFSEAMNPNVTFASFVAMKGSSFQMVTVTTNWSGGNTVLTCTPTAPLPAGYTVTWFLDGENPLGDPLTDSSSFTVSSGGSTSTGCDSSASMVSVTVSKGWMFEQTSAAAPAPATNSPYCFLACATIPCPRDATNVSLRTPLGSVNNLSVTAIAGHLTYLDCSSVTPDALDAFYGIGDYTFTIQAVSSNQNITVNFPATLTPPAVPHIANWAAAQAIDPAQAFSLNWDAISDGTAADCIYVEIYGGVFKTPNMGQAGALNGTAMSVLIPAGTLQPNSTNSGIITVYRYQLLTNSTSHISLAYRASMTEFTLATSNGSTTSLVIGNATTKATAGKFSFDITCSPGQTVIVERALSLLPGSWTPVWTNTASSSVVQFSEDLSPTGASFFYRARKGP